MYNIKSIERSYRGESFYYEVGSYITLDRGYGIENVKIGAIRYDDKANEFILIDEEWYEILRISYTDDVIIG